MLYSIAKSLALPPASFFVLFLLGLLLVWWKQRVGRAFLWGLLFVVYLSTTPFIASELMAPLQAYPPVNLQQPDPEVGAIVVLGAGASYGAPEYETAGAKPEIAADGLTLQRLQYAAYLAKATGKPVLVSGGPKSTLPPYTVAEAMDTALQRDLGVATHWIEQRSTSTFSNARLSATQLRQAGIRRFYLVTHAWHMPRAILSFEDTGLEPIPAPTRFVSRSEMTWHDFVPSANAFNSAYYAVHEWLGLWWHRLNT